MRVWRFEGRNIRRTACPRASLQVRVCRNVVVDDDAHFPVFVSTIKNSRTQPFYSHMDRRVVPSNGCRWEWVWRLRACGGIDNFGTCKGRMPLDDVSVRSSLQDLPLRRIVRRHACVAYEVVCHLPAWRRWAGVAIEEGDLESLLCCAVERTGMR